MERKESQEIAKGIKKGIYRTFKIESWTVIVDDFTYRRIFKDPDVPPHRKYTFIHGIYLVNNCPRLILKTKKSFFLSRYIMHASKDDLVDHKNRNRLDNRRCNLRFANYRQNSLNRRLKSNTGLIGVSYFKSFIRASFNGKAGKRLIFARLILHLIESYWLWHEINLYCRKERRLMHR